ncbi:hypothetical protein [Limnofasciculus baicalensis]|uniref:Uncharacterized protein n=1 Tax=Limnofasciculus baicalensis BBK-W-15 TaxID=2699891 RepID=A0AAE3GNH4_9CYAN|nr:hypothetical protein [Limnofasciculus baicalensis]MCP2727826.1 hypothetical protein [Limnofasciculus baicalensis BBK-W-15]
MNDWQCRDRHGLHLCNISILADIENIGYCQHLSQGSCYIKAIALTRLMINAIF